MPVSLLDRAEPFSSHMSWAVWPLLARTHEGDWRGNEWKLALPYQTVQDKAALGRDCHVDAVFLGLNRSRPTSSPSQGAAAVPWGNFHTSPRHNDHLLAAVALGTPLHGALMTDISAQIEGDGAKVKITAADVKRLAEQLEGLGAIDPVIVAMHSTIAPALKKYRDELAPITARTGASITSPKPGASASLPLRVVTVPHYSSRNHTHHFGHPGTYRGIVHDKMDTAFATADWGDWRSTGLPRPAKKG